MVRQEGKSDTAIEKREVDQPDGGDQDDERNERDERFLQGKADIFGETDKRFHNQALVSRNESDIRSVNSAKTLIVQTLMCLA